MQTMQSIANFCVQTEKILNIPGYIPLVSNLSGLGRAVMGQIQWIGGLGVAAVAGCLGVVAELNNDLRLASHYFFVAEGGLRQAGNGFLNIIRGGVVEQAPVFGNIACGLYDLAMQGTQLLSYIPQAPKAVWAGTRAATAVAGG